MNLKYTAQKLFEAARGDAGAHIVEFAIGDDNTAVDESDATLYNETYRDAVASLVVTLASITVTGLIDGTTHNGLDIAEMGLFCADGTMIARDVNAVPVVKNLGEQYEVVFVIELG